MNEAEARRAFESLPLPQPSSPSSSFFTAVALSADGAHKLAKDEGGCPCLLVATGPASAGQIRVPLVFENLAVLFDLRCEVSSPNIQHQSGTFTVVKCVAPDTVVRNYFLALLPGISAAMGSTNDRAKVAAVIEDIVELFRALAAIPKKQIQGVWGELLLINEAKDVVTLAESWHAEPGDCYDFNRGSERIEVKTTSQEPRQHWFTLDQLCAPAATRVVVASILVRRSGAGRSVFQLMDEIRMKLESHPHAYLRIVRQIHQTLGTGWQNAQEVAFDYEAAKQSVRFYDAEEIPKVAQPLPPGVSNVSFLSALDGVPPLMPKSLSDAGPLFRSLASMKTAR